MASRDSRILEILVERKKIEVAELADELGVSKVTIRKDLDGLESRGIIVREHGLALLASVDNVQGRLAYHYDEKLRIARHAADLIHEGDTVMIENGSCCALLALTIAETFRDVTIVTNSAFIAGYIRTKPCANTVLLGGYYQNDAEVNVGPMVRQSAQNFNVDLLFIGVDGYVEGAGFTNGDQFRAQAVLDMAERAGTVVALTESAKFRKRGVVPMRLGDKPCRVITDDGITAMDRRMLKAAGIDVETVPSP